MTEHIRRFLESPNPETQHSLSELYGSDTFRDRIRGLTGQDREDAAIEHYVERLRDVGRFAYVCSAIVLHPERDRTHFHLIYCTRNKRGVEVFKDAERNAMAVQEKARASALQRTRIVRTGQPSLLSNEELHDSSHYDGLRHRYLTKSKALVRQILQERHRVLYDDVWKLAMSQPLTWDRDLKQWIVEWTGTVRVDGLKPRQRVPRLGESNYLVWTAL
jgi:hypothetical protein